MTLIYINKYYLPSYLERLKRNNKEDTNEERLYYLERRASTRRKTRNGRLLELEELVPSNKGYTTLAWALLSFKPGYNQNAASGSLEEQLEFLRRLITVESIQIDKLKEEYNLAMSSDAFTWINFLKANEILPSTNNMSENDAKEWVRSRLVEFL